MDAKRGKGGRAVLFVHAWKNSTHTRLKDGPGKGKKLFLHRRSSSSSEKEKKLHINNFKIYDTPTKNILFRSVDHFGKETECLLRSISWLPYERRPFFGFFPINAW